MNRMEELRSLLHKAMDCGDYDEILKISQMLDVEIVNYMRKTQNEKRAKSQEDGKEK